MSTDPRPADILAAARQNVVGPYLLAWWEWLMGWVGPVQFLCRPGDTSPNDSLDGWEDASTCTGSHLRHPDGGRLVAVADVVDRIRLDVHRPEVRDHLVRLGCPEWARDVPAGVWAWGSGCAVSYALRAWEWDQRPGVGKRPRWVRRSNEGPRAVLRSTDTGWFYSADICGPETGDEGRACADLAALNAGCILRVEGGWLVPLPGGGIGFFKGGES